MSTSFAAAASSKKEGESTLDAKLGVLEQQLREAEKQMLASRVSERGKRILLDNQLWCVTT